MTVLPLRYAPDPILRRKTNRVGKIDGRIRKLVDDMFETMYATNGVGLAAPQIGVSYRILVMGIPDAEREETEEIVIINPEWVKRGGERQVDEGCLSIPGYRGKLTRSEWVKVKGIDLDGRPVRLKGEGLLAHALEHEIDHLDGVLYIDRMKEQDTLDTLTQIDPEESVEVAAD